MDNVPVLTESKYFQPVSKVLGRDYGNNNFGSLFFDTSGSLTHNKTRMAADDSTIINVYPPESEILDSLTSCNNLVQVVSARGSDAVAVHLKPVVRKVLKLVQLQKSDGTIFEAHIVNKGDVHRVYKTVSQEICFKECYVALDRNLCMDNMAKSKSKTLCECLLETNKKRGRNGNGRKRKKIQENTVKTCLQNANVSILPPRSSKKKFRDTDEIPLTALDHPLYQVGQKSNLHLILKKSKRDSHSSLLGRSVVQECNNLRGSEILKPFLKATKKKYDNNLKQSAKIYKTRQLRSDNLDTDWNPKMSQTQAPNRAVQKKSTWTTPRKTEIPQWFPKKKGLVESCEPKLIQLKLTTASKNFIKLEKHEKIVQSSSLDPTQENPANNPEVLHNYFETDLKLDRVINMEIDDPVDHDRINKLGRGSEEFGLSPTAVVKIRPRIEKLLGRFSSVYRGKHLKDFEESPGSASSLINLRKRFATSMEENYLNVRIIKNDVPASRITIPSDLEFPELLNLDESVVLKLQNDIVKLQQIKRMTNLHLLQELPEFNVDGWLTEIEDIDSTAAIPKLYVDVQDESLLEGILEDALCMEEESKYFENLVGGNEDFPTLDFLPMDLIHTPESISISAEDFQTIIFELKQDVLLKTDMDAYMCLGF